MMPRFKPLDVYEDLYFTPTNVRYISACGGRGGGRSHNCSEYFIFKIMQENYFRGIMMRAIFGDLEKTTWLEFIDRIENTDGIDINDFKINDSKKIIEYVPTGNTITGMGFHKASGNRKASLKGFANVTDVLIEEAQEITESELNQLDDSLRTILAPIKIIFAFNMPEASHILMKRFFDLHPVELQDGHGREIEGFSIAVPKKERTDHLMIFSDYKDNYEHIDAHTRENYERYWFENPEHYFSEIKGYVFNGAKGVIFKFNRHWFLYDKLPDMPFHEVYSLDFGGAGGEASDEPDGKSKTVFGRLHINKDLMRVYVKILLYKGYISSQDLYEYVKNETIKIDEYGKKTRKKVMADNARKDKIKDMLNDKIYVVGAKTKEGGSNQIKAGYDILKKYSIYIHVDDKHAQTELNNHKWEVNKLTKEPTGNIEDSYKDVLDMIRYAVVNYDLYNN